MLEEYLKKHDLWYRFIDKTETVHTADASKATGIELYRITKNLISITNTGEYVLLIVPGDRRVNLKKAADALGVKNVQLMPFSKAEAISGYPPGGTPSVGLKEKIRTVMEQDLSKYDTLFCGGGKRDRLLELKVEDVVRISKAVITSIS